MPYRVQKPYIIVDGQRRYMPAAAPTRMPVCDGCNELAANFASLFKEEAPDKWWKWLSYPKFPEQEEAFMGCVNHPIEAEIQFLDGHVESFTGRLPETRWEHWKWHIIIAAVLAVLAAVMVEPFVRLIRR